VIGLMQDFGIPPDGNTYHEIVHTYIVLSDVDAVENVINFARQTSTVLTKNTYLELLRFYVDVSLPERAIRTSKAMLDSGYTLDVQICNCILGLVDRKNVEDIFWKMLNRGIRPNVNTFRLLIRVFKQNNDILEKVEKVMDKYGIKYQKWNNDGRTHIIILYR